MHIRSKNYDSQRSILFWPLFLLFVVCVPYANATRAPVCDGAYATPSTLWPPNHSFAPISISGVIDPEGGQLDISVQCIKQDEPLNSTGDGNFEYDAGGVGTSGATVRQERKGNGNGRVYHISYIATDPDGWQCGGTATVGVPKSKKRSPVDGGALYDSVPNNNATCDTADINNPPQIADQLVEMYEDTSIDLTIEKFDPDADTLTVEIVETPVNGTLTVNGESFVYTPQSNFHGQDLFTVVANDGLAPSRVATISITVLPVNDAPVAGDLDFSISDTDTVSFSLPASDIDSEVLTYTTISTPLEGTISGAAPDLLYTPKPRFSGIEELAYKVSDGQLESSAGVVSFDVTRSNVAPVLSPLSLVTDEDESVASNIVAEDIDGDPITFRLGTAPVNGEALINGGQITYTPDRDYFGDDSLVLIATDGFLDSVPLTVPIVVNERNTAPIAVAASYDTLANEPLEISLAASDPEDDELIFSIVEGPSLGVLSGNTPALVYTPGTELSGQDYFTFSVSDGRLESEIVRVDVSVIKPNSAPQVNSQSLTMIAGGILDITLTGTDVDTDVLSFTVETQPQSGTLSGVLPNLVYTPNTDFVGGDNFTFFASDETDDSEIGVVTIEVERENLRPVALGEELTVQSGNSLSITLEGTDNDGDSLSYEVVGTPQHGVISDTSLLPSLIYTANENYSGTDAITFVVSDGKLESEPATITVTVLGSNARPTANAGPDVLARVGDRISLDGFGSDPDADVLVYTWSVLKSPSNSSGGIVSIVDGLAEFTPDRIGIYQVKLIVNDGQQDSLPDIAEIVVSELPPQPTALIEVFAYADKFERQSYFLSAFPSTASNGLASDDLTYRWSIIEPASAQIFKLGSRDVYDATQDNEPVVVVNFPWTSAEELKVSLIVSDGGVDSEPYDLTIPAGTTNPPSLTINAQPQQVVGEVAELNLIVNNFIPLTDDLIQAGFIRAIVPVFPPWNGEYVTNLSVIERPEGSFSELTVSSDTSKPEPFDFSDVEITSSLHLDVPGTYRVLVTTDNQTPNGLASEVVTILAASPDNAAPLAAIAGGAVQEITVDNTPVVVELDGTGSTDGDGQSLDFDWTLATPVGSNAELISPESDRPRFVADVRGRYEVSLIVSDGQSFSQSVQSTIFATGSTTNSVPIAQAKVQEPWTAGVIVELDGAGSVDADGDPLTYTWTLVSSPSIGVETPSDPDFDPDFDPDDPDFGEDLFLDDPSLDAFPDPGSETSVELYSGPRSSVDEFIPEVPGLYRFSLVVSDWEASSEPAFIRVNVVADNLSPIAKTNTDRGTVFYSVTGLPVTLDGSASFDPEGSPLVFSWAVLSAPEGSAIGIDEISLNSSVDFVPDTAGRYVLELVVNDGEKSDRSRIQIEALAENNQAPVAVFADQIYTEVGEIGTIDATGSFDADGDDIFLKSWSLVRVSHGRGLQLYPSAQSTLRYSAPLSGIYTLGITFTDGVAVSDVEYVDLIVGGVQPEAKVFAASDVVAPGIVALRGDQSVDSSGRSIIVNPFTYNVSPPVDYSWALVSTPTGSVASLSSTDIANPDLNADLPGEYIVELVVTDPYTNSLPKQLVIDVEEASSIVIVADAGPDQTVLLGDSAVLDASNSSISDGAVVSYEWTENGSVLSTVATFTKDDFELGEYTVILRITDSSGVSSEDTIIIVVQDDGNGLLPIADAGPDQIVTLGDVVVLDGSNSYDPDEDFATYEWYEGTELLSESVVFTKSDFAVGEHEVRLVVTSFDSIQSDDLVLVTVESSQIGLAPIADAGLDFTIELGEEAFFDGSFSYDPDGELESYLWTEGTTILSDAPKFYSTDFSLGTHVVELQVTDVNGNVDSDSVVLTVIEPVQNLPPVAEDLKVTLLEDTSVVLQLVFSDPNPGSSLVYSIVDRPTNGSVKLENGKFVYTPAPDYFGSDQLTFSVSDGELESNLGVVDVVVTSVNDIPVAFAGQNVFAEVGDLVELDGTGTVDDGFIDSYLWTIEGDILGTGSVITLNSLPVGEHIIRLEVTDEVGATASDTVLVEISHKPVPGFIISEVRGNTASAGSDAYFTIALTTEPEENVTIPIESSDPLEGVISETTVVISKFDWNVPHPIVVTGNNEVVIDGAQNFTIVLGPAQSADPKYNGLDPSDVNISGLDLSLGVDENSAYFVSELLGGYKPEFTANGSGKISHILAAGPPGLDVSEIGGVISWTPPKSAEGNVHTVNLVSTMNGVEFANSVAVHVLPSTEVTGTATTDRFEVTDESSSLRDFQFDYRGQLPTDVRLREVDLSRLPLPIGAQLLTSGFYSFIDVPFDLYIPVDFLADPSDATRLEYYTWNQGAWWGSSFVGSRVVLGQREYAKLHLPSTNGLGAIAVRLKYNPDHLVIDTARNKTPQFTEQLSKRAANLRNVHVNDVSCILPSNDAFVQVCTVAGVFNPPDHFDPGALTKFVVVGFGEGNKHYTFWGGTTIETMMTWIAQARFEFDDLGLGNVAESRMLTIRLFEEPPDPDTKGIIQGRVCGGCKSEKGRVIHLNTHRSITLSASMQVTVAHELFHYAQANTVVQPGGGRRPFLSSDFPGSDINARWIAESTASWFEDHLYDSVNGYTHRLPNPLEPVLQGGIYGERNQFRNNGNPYQLAPMFKMFAEYCSKFEVELVNLFYSDFPIDESFRINYLRDFLANAKCDFGPQAGPTKSSTLEAAFLLYQYATLHVGPTDGLLYPSGRMSVLDSNEPDIGPGEYFPRSSGALGFKQFPPSPLYAVDLHDLPLSPNSTFDVKRKIDLPPYSAYSFQWDGLWSEKEVLEKYLMDNDQGPYPVFRRLEAVVSVSSVNGPIKIGLLSDEAAFQGNSTIQGEQHYFYDSDRVCNGEYVFKRDAEGTGIISLVNTSEKAISNVEVTFSLRDHKNIKDASKNVSLSRVFGLEFEDSPETAIRKMNWDSANAHCEAMGEGWRLPTLAELYFTGYQNRSGDGSFRFNALTEFYWTSSFAGSYVSGDRYHAVDGNGAFNELSTSGAGISKSSERHFRCVKETTNICELP